MKFLLITIIIILFRFIDISAQSRNEVLAYQKLLEPAAKVDEFLYVKKINNEFDFILSGLFLFYKRNISSQDAVSCTFYPSCSVYAFQSFHKKGLLEGSVMIFDRLTRCNALSPEKYKVHAETKLLYDPPD